MDKPKRRKKVATSDSSPAKKKAARKPKKAAARKTKETEAAPAIVDPRTAQAQDERTVAAPPEPLPELKESRLTNIAYLAGKTVARLTRKR